MPTKQPTLPARLKTVMSSMKWTQADLAEVTGASKQTVSGWLTDGHRTIDARFAFELQRATGFCAEWVMYGVGPERMSDEADEVPGLRAEQLRHTTELLRIFREQAGKK